MRTVLLRWLPFSLLLLSLLNTPPTLAQLELEPQMRNVKESALARVPELSGDNTPLSAQAILWLEDGRYAEASRELEVAIAASPDHLGLRFLRATLVVDSTQAGQPTHPQADSGHPAADTFEQLALQTLTLHSAPENYRGDKEEDARTFITRLEREAGALHEKLDRLNVSPKARPWVMLLQSVLNALLKTHSKESSEALWSIADQTGSWQLFYHLTSLGLGLSFPLEQDWFETTAQNLQAENSPFSGISILFQIYRRTNELPVREAAALWLETASHAPDDSFNDDIHLAAGRFLARAPADDLREQSIPQLEPLTRPPWRNTTLEAVRELGNVLRKLNRYPEAVTLYERFEKEFPSSPDQFYRDLGRALYRLERYEKAADAFQRSSEGASGRGKDYLYLAQVMRYLPRIDANRYPRQQTREEALKLVDFAAAAQREEKRVAGWHQGESLQITELKARFTELVALSTHALLFELTYISVGLLLLLATLSVAVGLVTLVSYPRLGRRVWYRAVLLSTLLTALPAIASVLGLPSPVGTGALMSFLSQAFLRLFFVTTAAFILGPVLALPTLTLARGLRRALLFHRLLEWGKRQWPLLVALLALTALFLLERTLKVSPISYLFRFPTLWPAAELGLLPSEASSLAGRLLLIFHALQTELLARGVLLPLILIVWPRGGPGAAVLGSAVLWATLTLGLSEPAISSFLLCLGQGVVFGWLRQTKGLDSSLLAHALLTGLIPMGV